jgi:hypothetical protein
MLKYTCCEEFELNWVDEDGLVHEEMQPETIHVDSLWELVESKSRDIGLEIRLNSLDDSCRFSWIEISKEVLEECFYPHI